ncbi:MAG: AbrB/MazE/SpoVT family DNA-binding domain-containing protein [Cyclobacteriaceae bacterium]
MKLSIIKIGNSKGIKLSKKILEQYQITDEVELTLETDSIIMRPVLSPRKGWDEAFKQMAARGEDELLLEDAFESE